MPVTVPSFALHTNALTKTIKKHQKLTLLKTYSKKIERELRVKSISRNARISTLDDYAYLMRFTTPNRCLFGNTPELHLITQIFSLNVAVFQKTQIYQQKQSRNIDN